MSSVISANASSQPLIVRTQNVTKIVENVKGLIYGRFSVTAELGCAEAKPEQDFFIAAEVGSSPRGNKTFACLAPFHTERAMSQAFELASEVLISVTLFGIPARTDSVLGGHSQSETLKDTVVLDLRQLQRQGAEEFYRQEANLRDIPEHTRIILLGDDDGEQVPPSIVKQAQNHVRSFNFRNSLTTQQFDHAHTLGVPKAVLLGEVPIAHWMVRIIQTVAKV